MAASIQQIDDFVVPIICYKVDNRANHCYFRIFHCLNFHLGKMFRGLSFPLINYKNKKTQNSAIKRVPANISG